MRAVLPAAAPARWLFDEVAVDIPFTAEGEVHAIEARLRDVRGDLPIDIVVQPEAVRRKKLFLADMDSTMIGQECIDELADFAGLKAHVAGITERAMRGEIAFEPALRERVALLKGLSVSVVDEVLQKRITLTPGGRELVATMRAHGAWTCLISGGFTLFTNKIAAQIGFQENRANELVVEDGQFTGEVREPILGRATKLATLIELSSLRPRRNRYAGGRRRRQRPRHDSEGRVRGRLSRQARGLGRGRGAHRSWRPHRAALRTGLSQRGIRGDVVSQRHPGESRDP